MVAQQHPSPSPGSSRKGIPKRNAASGISGHEESTKNATTDAFCASVGPVLLNAAEQTAISVGKALMQALKGIITAGNITKCLHCAVSNADDGIEDGNNKQPNCGQPDTSTPGGSAPGNSAPRRSTPNNGLNRNKEGAPIPIQDPTEDQGYIDYPIRFDQSTGGPETRMSSSYVKEPPVRTKWQNVKQTSVSERWRRMSSQRQRQPLLYAN